MVGVSEDDARRHTALQREKMLPMRYAMMGRQRSAMARRFRAAIFAPMASISRACPRRRPQRAATQNAR